MKWERCLNDQDWTPHSTQCSTCPPFHCFLYSALQQFLRLWTEPKRNCKIWWYIYHSITVGCKERLCSLSHSSKTKAFLTTSSSSSTTVTIISSKTFLASSSVSPSPHLESSTSTLLTTYYQLIDVIWLVLTRVFLPRRLSSRWKFNIYLDLHQFTVQSLCCDGFFTSINQVPRSTISAIFVSRLLQKNGSETWIRGSFRA